MDLGSTAASREARRSARAALRSDSRRLVPNWSVDCPPNGGFALAVSRRFRFGFPDRWMLDSGASYHLVSFKDLGKRYRSDICSCFPFMVHSSNGVITVDRYVMLPFPHLTELVRVHVTADTPAVLSVGRLSSELGLGFQWPTGGTPSLCMGKRRNDAWFPLLVQHSVHFWTLGTLPLQGPAHLGAERPTGPGRQMMLSRPVLTLFQTSQLRVAFQPFLVPGPVVPPIICHLSIC